MLGVFTLTNFKTKFDTTKSSKNNSFITKTVRKTLGNQRKKKYKENNAHKVGQMSHRPKSWHQQNENNFEKKIFLCFRSSWLR
jgi:hypothetical protein